jgi:hypothetical protein
MAVKQCTEVAKLLQFRFKLNLEVLQIQVYNSKLSLVYTYVCTGFGHS